MRLSVVCLAVIFLIALAASFSLPAEDANTASEVLVTYKGHAETVYAVAVSPDGKQLLTGSFDKTIKRWDLVSGKELQTFGGDRGHQNIVLSVAYAPDGQSFASGASDNTAKIWDVPASKALRELALTESAPAVAVSNDGKSAAAGGKDGAIKLLNPSDGKELFTLKGHVGPVTSLVYAPNNQSLASVGVDGTLRLWNLADGKALAAIFAHSKPIHAVAFSVNSNAVFTAADDGIVKSWQLPVAAPKALAGHGDTVRALAVSGDGSIIVTGCADKNVRVYGPDGGNATRTLTASQPITAVAVSGPGANALTLAGTSAGKIFAWGNDGKLIVELQAHTGDVTGLALSPAGNEFASVGADGKLETWALPLTAKTTKPTNTITAHAGGATGVAYAPNNVLFTCGKDKVIKQWDVKTAKATRTIGPLPDPTNAIAIGRDGAQIAAAAGKQVKIWTVADAKEVQTLAHPAEVISVAFNADRSRVVTGATDNLARVWDVAKGLELQAFSHGAAVHGVAFPLNRPNNVITVSADKTAVINTVANTRATAASPAPLRALVAIPNGTHLLLGGDDKSVQLLNINSGATDRKFIGAAGPVLGIAISRNGNLLATASADKTVRIYTFNDGKLVGQFQTPAPVRSLSLNQQATALLTSGDGKAATLWNIAYQPGNPLPPQFGKPLQRFEHPGNAIAALSSDGTSIITGCDDKFVRVWRVAADGPTRNFQHPNLVDCVAYNKDGTQLATGCHDGILRIFDVGKGALTKQINAHAQPQPSAIYTVAWSPDGKQIASGSFDRSIKIWDAASGNLIKEIKGFDEKAAPKGHTEGVFCVVWTPDGKQIVSGASDRTIKMWNVADGSFVRVFANPNLPPSSNQLPVSHAGWVYHLRFTSGGQIVSVGGAPHNHGYVALWNPADGKLLFGAELPLSPFYDGCPSPDGKSIAIACGPKSRQSPEAEAVLLKLGH